MKSTDTLSKPESIRCFEKDGVMFLEVHYNDNNTYSVAWKSGDRVRPSVDMLEEYIMNHRLGFTKHDLMMAVGNYLIENKE